ncbi:MAG TPA: cupredoxin domain-containing protein, partial [Thermomicrobiales bacterium]|nr:cupredoxin domain-containing protein [Thermomicrobiales bacterium]
MIDSRPTGETHNVAVPGLLLRVLMVMTLVVAMSAGSATPASAQDLPSPALPPVELDALDPAQWSVTAIITAPGQVISITNRGVQPHTFAVCEWGIDVPLPTLQRVDITVPDSARPEEVFTFFCSEPSHRELGREGTIVDQETARALAAAEQVSDNPEADRIVIETSDALAWSPNTVDVAPGQILEIRNVGVLEHHFAIDEWGVNETISAGEIALIPVPDDVTVGQTFIFYCSVPGHRPGGMEGTLTIVEGTVIRTGAGAGLPAGQARGSDLDRFLPQPRIFGAGWSEVRNGNARAVIPDFDRISSQIFPGEGRGARGDLPRATRQPGNRRRPALFHHERSHQPDRGRDSQRAGRDDAGVGDRPRGQR